MRAKRQVLQAVLEPIDPAGAEEGAENLLREFEGSLARIFAAREARLAKVLGSSAAARHLKTCRAALLLASRERIEQRPVLGVWPALIAYLSEDMAASPTEQVRVLFLDSRDGLLADETVSNGSIDSAWVSVREIVVRALDVGASAMIVVHNHPSGLPEPSRQDVMITRQLKDACLSLGIMLRDHVIVATSGWSSFRTKGLL